jgi:hypothetical protein
MKTSKPTTWLRRFFNFVRKKLRAMNTYYDSLLKQYESKYMPQIQKTPAQIQEEQEAAAYQKFLTEKDGIDALNELKSKFDIWYRQQFPVQHPAQSTEVKELKEMIVQMAKQNEEMANQMKSLTNQFK